MKIIVPPGKYILAVSGGVDSVFLLDELAKRPGVELIVAHFDHGIRTDSGQDAKFVAKLAKDYDLTFEFCQGRLGPTASEDVARKARYRFLNQLVKKHNARLVTAHHQDDLIETAFINLLRGTGHRGLASMGRGDVLRLLLDIPKQEIIKVATKRQLKWREDPSNQNTDYLRNYIRHNLMPKMTPAQRAEIIAMIQTTATLSNKIESVNANLLQILGTEELDRAQFILLPADVSAEIMTAWLRGHNLRQFDKNIVSRLVSAVKTAKPGTTHPVYGGWMLNVGRQKITLVHP